MITPSDVHAPSDQPPVTADTAASDSTTGETAPISAIWLYPETDASEVPFVTSDAKAIFNSAEPSFESLVLLDTSPPVETRIDTVISSETVSPTVQPVAGSSPYRQATVPALSTLSLLGLGTLALTLKRKLASK